MRLFEITQAQLPNLKELFALSKNLRYWLNLVDLLPGEEMDEKEEKLKEKIEELERAALALGYDVDMDAAEYPFDDLHWIHVETNTPVTFTSDQLAATQH